MVPSMKIRKKKEETKKKEKKKMTVETIEEAKVVSSDIVAQVSDDEIRRPSGAVAGSRYLCPYVS